MDNSFILSIIGLTVAVIAWIVVTRESFVDQLGPLGRMLKLVVGIGVAASALWLGVSFVAMFLELA